jgi:hypothetical protein
MTGVCSNNASNAIYRRIIGTFRHGLGLVAGDIEALAGLPEGYFQGKTNVVEFVRPKAVQKTADDRPGQGNKVVQFRPVSKS